jgi:hypothetical protein
MESRGKQIAAWVAGSVVVGVAVIALFGGVALAQGPRGGMMGGNGGGMMGNGGWGMMGGFGPRIQAGDTVSGTQQYGRGFGMMGGWNRGNAKGERLTTEQVQKRVTEYLGSYDNSADLKAVEVMEFQDNFYAQIQEKSTGVNAFELLVDPYTGNVWPEFGPNMMWNTKYGMMQNGGRGSGLGGMMGMMRGFDWGGPTAQQSTADMTVTPQQAVKAAQDYLDREKLGLTAETTPDTFYGYYTIHTLGEDGKTVGMLSVNGYTGRVWYHTWHGQFINMVETGTQA